MIPNVKKSQSPSRTRKLGTVLVATALSIGLAHSAAARIDVVVKSDGTDPKAFPNLKVNIGKVYFDTPMAKMFGLDVDNNFQPLPANQRFPGDFFGSMAMQKFLSASPFDQKARGILFGFGDFNNPNPGTPQESVKLTFTIPLVDQFGNPLGGSGTRWIKFQNGPWAGGNGGGGGPVGGGGAGGAGGGGGGGDCHGRSGAWLQPPRTPLRIWAGVIKRFTGGTPGFPNDEPGFRAAVKAAIAAKLSARGRTAEQIDKYLKLVDGSDFMDPAENWVARLPTSINQREMTVELAMLIEHGSFIKVAELLNNFSVAITNDATLASMDPRNQPPGEMLLDAIDLGSARGGSVGISLAMSDVIVDATTVVSGQADFTLVDNAAEVTFHTSGKVEQTGSATQYLDLTLADGDIYRVPFDQAVGATGEDIAKDLAMTVNVWPHDGGYPFRATVFDNRVQIHHSRGDAIKFAEIYRTNDSEHVEEQLVFGTCRGGGEECRGDIRPDDDDHPKSPRSDRK